MSKKVPTESADLADRDRRDPGRLADTIAAHMSVDWRKSSASWKCLVRERLEHLMGLMDAEIDLFRSRSGSEAGSRKQMEKSQREYYLNEQMKAIQKELGEMDDAPNEGDELQARIEKARCREEAQGKSSSELSKLKMMSPMSAEASVSWLH